MPALYNMQEFNFKTIYKENFNKVRFYAKYYLNNEHEAENVAQEVFIVLWNNRKKFTSESEILPYLTVICRNLCINILRRRINISKYHRYNEKYNQDSMALNALYDYSSTAVYINEINTLMEKALNKMPDKIRTTFRQCRVQGLKYEEVAIAENISIKTVEYRMSYALKILRKYFKDYLVTIILILAALWTKI